MGLLLQTERQGTEEMRLLRQADRQRIEEMGLLLERPEEKKAVAESSSDILAPVPSRNKIPVTEALENTNVVLSSLNIISLRLEYRQHPS